MRRAVLIVTVAGVWISVAASVIGFVLPWATLDVNPALLQGGVKAAHLPGPRDMQSMSGTESWKSLRDFSGQLTQALPATEPGDPAKLGGRGSPAAEGGGTTDLQALAGKLTSKIGRVTIQFKRGTETIAGELLPDLSTIPASVSGLEIPQLVNRQDAKVAMAFAEMFTGQRDLGAKSYAVYLLPGLALLGGALVTLAGRMRLVCVGIGGMCLAIAGVGFWKLLTIKTGTLPVAITIGPGLWLSLWAYVGLGICAILFALTGDKRRWND